MCRVLLLAGCLGLVVHASAVWEPTGNWTLTATVTQSANETMTGTSDSARDVTKTHGTVSTATKHTQSRTTQASNVFVDTSMGLLTKEEKEFAILVLQEITYVILPFAFIATLCNVIIFAQKSLKSSTSKYIIALSVAQIVYLIIDVGARIMVASFKRSIHEEYAYFAYNLYIFNWVPIIRRASYIIMCLVSFERIYAIARPLHIKSFVLVRYPLCFIFASFVVTVVYHFYIFAKLRIERFDLPNGATLYNYAKTDYYYRNAAVIDNLGVSSKVLFSYIPLFLLMIQNVLTLFLLHRYREARAKMKTSSNADEEVRKQRQMTVTLLGATIGFFILSLPIELHSILSNVHPSYNYWGSEQNIFLFFQEFAYVCHMFSCFPDFVSFLFLSTAYRQALFTLFRCHRFSKSKQHNADNNTVVSTVSVNDYSVSTNV